MSQDDSGSGRLPLQGKGRQPLEAGAKKKKPNRRKRRSPASASRASNRLLLVLLKLRQRVAGNARLSVGDRQLVVLLLDKIASDEDPRELFWGTIKHRPTRPHDIRAWRAVFIYEARVALGKGKPGKSLAGAVAILSGLKDSQVEQARRNYGDEVRARVAMWPKDQLSDLLICKENELKDQSCRK